jgi:hypothetical protein
VICDDDIAFVTIHGGTTCRGNINQLDILNIKNIAQPTLLQRYPMTSPKGIALTENHLYLCDNGLKILDRKDPVNMKLKAYFEELKVTDAITLGDKLLLLIGEDGFYQYDITDPINPKELSKILVK